MIPFASLHNHTTFSIFDGLKFPGEHADAAFASGMDAFALTDHGNLNGFPYLLNHTNQMKKDGKKFKAIFGVESYFVNDIEKWWEEYDKKSKAGQELKNFGKRKEDSYFKRNHLLLLAQNQVGLNNLFSIISASHNEKYYYKFPRIDYNLLSKHNEGLIVSSACLGGIFGLTYTIMQDQSESDILDEMRSIAKNMLDIFGDRFYFEIQWNAIPKQSIVNHLLFKLANEFGRKVISTCDAHFPTKNLWKEREVYKRLGFGSKGSESFGESPEWMVEALPEKIEELQWELFIKNGDEVFGSYKKNTNLVGSSNLFDDESVIRSITNTVEVSERIEDFAPLTNVILPQFVAAPGEEDVVLAKECIGGLKSLGLSRKKNYVERLKEEIYTIQNRKFSRYFLTMKAIMDKSKEFQLVGTGRGSGVGSLAIYCLGITQVDPIKWQLQFERFLQKDGSGYPDIDTDHMDPMALKEMLIKDWGQDSVVPISNWNTLQLKSLIKDISKFYGIPFQETNDVTSKMLLEATPNAKLDHDIVSGVYTPTYEEAKRYSPTFAGFLNKYPQIDQHIQHLFGQLRSCSRHAGGVIVSDGISSRMPLIRSGGVIQTPWSEGQNVRHLEPLGFIKYDLLGLATLRMINFTIEQILKDKTFENVKKWYNENLHPDRINLEDKEVYEHVFHKGNFCGVFQFSEKGIQEFAKQAKPNTLEDISAISAIYRPGPLGIGADEKYVKAKIEPEKIEYKHKLIKKVLKDTFGVCIFQEQISSLARELGKDISLNEGNKLRKLLTKKGTGKHEIEIEEIKVKFIEGCVEKGLAKEYANELFDSMKLFSQYGFNKSHSIAYSLTSYQCAYLWTHYPNEWACAFLEKEPEDKKEKAISLVKSFNFTIEPLNVNTAQDHWVSNNKVLTPPLSIILGLGEKAIEQIMNYRPFYTIEDFIFNENIDYSKLNRRAIQALIWAGALNNFMDERFSNLKHFSLSILGEDTKERPKSGKKFGEMIEKYKDVEDYTKEEKIDFVTNITGIYPIDEIIDDKAQILLKSSGCSPISEFKSEKKPVWFIPRKITFKKTKKGKDYIILDITDSNHAALQLKIWSIHPGGRVLMNVVYGAYVTYQEQWGYSLKSTRALKQLVG